MRRDLENTIKSIRSRGSTIKLDEQKKNEQGDTTETYREI